MEANVLTGIIAAGVMFVGYELHRGNKLRRAEFVLRPDLDRMNELLHANFPHLLATFSRDYQPKLVNWINAYLDTATEQDRQREILIKHASAWLDPPDDPPSWAKC